jgi:hypothetical protein
MRAKKTLLLISGAALLCWAVQVAHGQELPPDVRAKLFVPTAVLTVPQDVVRIPMLGTDLQGNYKCPYFRVFVNGKGPFTFLYDSGAGYSLVSSRVAKAAGTPVLFDRHGHRDIVRISRLDVGTVSLHDLWVINDDTFGVDGILGANAFGTANLMFDLTKRELWVSKRRIDLPNTFEIPYGFEFNVPTVPVTIGSHIVPILIDTGDDAYGLELRRTELGDAAVQHPPVAAAKVMNGANSQQTAVTTLRDTVRLGPVESRNAVIAVNDDLPVGDFGYAVLRQFRFVFDPQSKTIRFQPQFDGRAFITPAQRSAGFRFAFDGSAKIVEVNDGSAAAAAGMVKGDRVIALNGRTARTLSPLSWDRLIERNGKLTVRWSHDGRERTTSLSTFPIE